MFSIKNNTCNIANSIRMDICLKWCSDLVHYCIYCHLYATTEIWIR